MPSSVGPFLILVSSPGTHLSFYVLLSHRSHNPTSKPSMASFDITPEKEASISNFLYRQLFVHPSPTPAHSVKLNECTAIVTGANSGLGLECCRKLLGLGLRRLVMAVRDESKGQKALASLPTSSASQPIATTIDVWSLDLSSYDSTTAFARRATQELERLDIVVMAAGGSRPSFSLNPSTHHEEVVQVNYLSTVLLTILLLPVMKSKNQTQHSGRIVLVSSDTAAWANIGGNGDSPVLSMVEKQENYNRQQQYQNSKLLGQLFLSEAARRVPPSVAILTAANPGLCYGTSLNRDAPPVIGSLVLLFVRLLGRSPSQGANVIINAATCHGSEAHGQYIGDNKIKPMAPLIYEPRGSRISEVLWRETMDALAFAGVEEIIREMVN
ncbi:NAD(P)-binding protein [Nemania abortiva]|nr:NAD(P)-binding protein [Nemania abortiva]